MSEVIHIQPSLDAFWQVLLAYVGESWAMLASVLVIAVVLWLVYRFIRRRRKKTPVNL